MLVVWASASIYRMLRIPECVQTIQSPSKSTQVQMTCNIFVVKLSMRTATAVRSGQCKRRRHAARAQQHACQDC